MKGAKRERGGKEAESIAHSPEIKSRDDKTLFQQRFCCEEHNRIIIGAAEGGVRVGDYGAFESFVFLVVEGMWEFETWGVIEAAVESGVVVEGGEVECVGWSLGHSFLTGFLRRREWLSTP